MSAQFILTMKFQQVIVLDNPTQSTNPFQFDITFECLQELPNDLEWKVTYVAEDQNQDQILGELVMVGPLVVGVNRFVLQAPPPNFKEIANDELIGVTVVLISCFYQDKEFLKIGYYVANEYTVDLVPNANGVGFVIPNPVDITLLRRNIAHDQPRVTRIPIDWYGGHNENIPYEADDPNEGENAGRGAPVAFRGVGPDGLGFA